MSEEELKDVKNELENIKEQDQKNKSGIIDADIFMLNVLGKYRVIMNRTKNFVIHAFQAADLDGNKKINHNEFVTLFRHIESDRFKFKPVVEMFYEAADIEDNKCLSFEKFTALCVNEQIFTEQQLNKFIGGNDLQLRHSEAKQTWPRYKEEVTQLLNELKPYANEQIYNDWEGIVVTLEQRILSNVVNEELKPILIAHKILKLELNRLVSLGQQDVENEDDDDSLISEET